MEVKQNLFIPNFNKIDPTLDTTYYVEFEGVADIDNDQKKDRVFAAYEKSPLGGDKLIGFFYQGTNVSNSNQNIIRPLRIQKDDVGLHFLGDAAYEFTDKSNVKKLFDGTKDKIYLKLGQSLAQFETFAGKSKDTFQALAAFTRGSAQHESLKEEWPSFDDPKIDRPFLTEQDFSDKRRELLDRSNLSDNSILTFEQFAKNYGHIGSITPSKQTDISNPSSNPVVSGNYRKYLQSIENKLEAIKQKAVVAEEAKLFSDEVTDFSDPGLFKSPDILQTKDRDVNRDDSTDSILMTVKDDQYVGYAGPIRFRSPPTTEIK